jgi:hypothetical protein
MARRLRADIHEDWGSEPAFEVQRLRETLSKSKPHELRAIINGHTDHLALEEECARVGIPVDQVRNYWYKGKHFSIFAKSKEVSYQQLRDELIAEMSDYAPIYPTIERHQYDDPHLLVIDPADIHIGKICSKTETGEYYDSNVATQRAIDGVRGILRKCRGYNIDKVVFVAGNDILHTDSPKKTTTSGTPQDTDGLWYDNYQTAKKLYIHLLELCVSLADTEVVFCPSNHDFMSGFMLVDSVVSWFSKCEQIRFHADMAHRKYITYHDNLLGFTHGDGAKTADLPLLMAHEAASDWNKKHRYVYTHHVHHKTSKDYMSVCVESLRSPSGTDGWHHRNGYQHSPKAVEGFLHHPNHGQVARLTHIF